MVNQEAPKPWKPYRNFNPLDPQAQGAEYKDLLKPSNSGEDIADALASAAVTIIYSAYSFPMTTKGDLLGHDGSSIIRIPVGTNGKVLITDSTETAGVEWGSLNTAKGDILSHNGTDMVSLAVGANSKFLVANSAEATGLKWTEFVTTKGDVGTHDGTAPSRLAVGTNGMSLLSASAETTGLKWQYSGYFGIAAGWGYHGSLTLGADTTLASGAHVRQYTTLDISTYTLQNSTVFTNYWIHIMAQTITGNGGIIQRRIFPSTNDLAGQLGGTGGGGGGAGGNGGDGSGALYVSARTISGTGTIRVNDGDATNGANATVASATANGNNGATGLANYRFFGETAGSYSAGGLTQALGGNSNGTAGGGANGAAMSWDPEVIELILDVDSWFSYPGPMDTTSGTPGSASKRRWVTCSGGGGSAGGRNNGGAQAGAGGTGAASYPGFLSGLTGKTGGNGGTGAAGGSGAGGGGGGSGGQGGILVVKCFSIASGWHLQCKGGNGGNGGNGFDRGGGGGAGAGGAGGIIFIFTMVAALCTTDVAGGTAGTPGTAGALGGNPGNSSSNGTDGYVAACTLGV